MSRPRPVLPGKTYLFTRRTTQRQYWLKPTPLTTQILEYCYAYAAWKTGVVLHALIGMSNHPHVVGTDVEGRYPEFLHRAHLLISKCINAAYGRWENLWSVEEPSVVELLDEEAVIDKIVYTLANPVTAGLVPNGEQWPGLRTTPEDLAGGRYIIKRPPVYFVDGGDMPEEIALEIRRPPGFDDVNDAQLVGRVRERLDAVEAERRDEARASGRRFLGVDAVLAVAPWDSPRTTAPRRGLRPRFAFSIRERFVAAVRELSRWLGRYDKCHGPVLLLLGPPRSRSRGS